MAPMVVRTRDARGRGSLLGQCFFGKDNLCTPQGRSRTRKSRRASSESGGERDIEQCQRIGAWNRTCLHRRSQNSLPATILGLGNTWHTPHPRNSEKHQNHPPQGTESENPCTCCSAMLLCPLRTGPNTVPRSTAPTARVAARPAPSDLSPALYLRTAYDTARLASHGQMRP